METPSGLSGAVSGGTSSTPAVSVFPKCPRRCSPEGLIPRLLPTCRSGCRENRFPMIYDPTGVLTCSLHLVTIPVFFFRLFFCLAVYFLRCTLSFRRIFLFFLFYKFLSFYSTDADYFTAILRVSDAYQQTLNRQKAFSERSISIKK